MATAKGKDLSPWGKQGGYQLNKTQARKALSMEDRQALPFLNKKCKDQDSPQFGMWQEDRLIKHITDRLQLSDFERMDRIQRMQAIDVQLSGHIRSDDRNDDGERERKRNNRKGKAPKAEKMSLPLAYAQLDEVVTYCQSLYSPEMNMFIATSTSNKQGVAEALTKEIGKQGQTLQYYRHVSKFLLNCVKYNLGALSCNWEESTGTVFAVPGSDGQSQSSISSGQLTTTKGTVWQGNVLRSVDMYNFLYDTSVHPVDLPLRGEYFAEVELQTPFRIRRMREQKILWGIERYINQYAPMANTVNAAFYRTKPRIRDGVKEGGFTTNWQQIFASGGPAQASMLGTELVWYTSWFNPSEYDLSDSPNMEIWRLCMANGRYITAAYKLEVAHNQLPVACGSPVEDDLDNNQTTYAEMLIPLQHFASFLLNTHVDATRKAIYGITLYDKNVFPGLDLDTEDLIGMRIPMKTTLQGQNIDQVFRHINDSPETQQNVEMVGKLAELMQKILPTNSAQQVADLERATEYQAAATVQASNRRNLKIARIINDQAITPIKFQMLYNIYQNMPVIEFTGSDGKQQKITPQMLFEAGIEFDVGTGLKGMDRLMQVSIFKDLMGYLFQVKGMDQQVDLLGLLSYVTQLAGFETDLSTFRIQQPAQATATQAAAEAAGENAGSQLPPANANQQGGTSAPATAAQ
jgi:hypothetical protein